MPPNRGRRNGNGDRTGGRPHQSVRWDLDQKIYARWKKFCADHGLPVQHEVEKALSLWMELPDSIRDRLEIP